MEFYSCLKASISLCRPPPKRFFLSSLLLLSFFCPFSGRHNCKVRFRAGDFSTSFEIAANSMRKLEINLCGMGERTAAKFESRNGDEVIR